jgi:hypothetical protein
MVRAAVIINGGAMRVYLAESLGRGGADLTAAQSATQARPLRLLLSYHYFRGENLDDLLGRFEGIPLDVFCDSGAYSAWSLGETVDPAEYTEWVRRWGHWFNLVAGPDVIGDPATTADATAAMSRALPDTRILPTFHVGEPWEYLTKYAAEYPYIALGGMVGHVRNRELLTAWLDRVFATIPSTTQTHGFGTTTWDLLLRYPFTSVDSSSWTSGFRFGTFALFDARRGRWVSVAMGDSTSILRNSTILRAYGLRPTQVTSKGYDRDAMVRALIASWQSAEDWLQTHTHTPVSGDKSCRESIQSPAGDQFSPRANRGGASASSVLSSLPDTQQS